MFQDGSQMSANGIELVARRERLKNAQVTHATRWDRMAPFVAPSRVGILTTVADGDKQTSGVYDSTTLMAAELMAMFIAGHIINPAQRWFGWHLRDSGAAPAADAVREWLEECRD